MPRPRRAGIGAGLALISLAAATAILLPVRDRTSLPVIVLLYLVPVLLTAAAGGLWPALGSAVAAALLANWFFVPPYRTLAVDTEEDVVVLVVYLLVAAAAGLAVERTAARAVEAEKLARVDRLRTALLGAVGHDLRTPIAGIKAAASSLRQSDVEFSAADRDELLATVEVSADRLTALVDNLLAVSRLQAGALSVELAPTALDAVVAMAVLSTGFAVTVDVPDDLPPALADAGLLERVLANLIANACAADDDVSVRATAEADRLTLAVVDHGPGIPAHDRDAVFAPFQRLGDTGSGLGLGLAIARGFTEAQGGTLAPTDTPGGGLTMIITLPVAPTGGQR